MKIKLFSAITLLALVSFNSFASESNKGASEADKVEDNQVDAISFVITSDEEIKEINEKIGLKIDGLTVALEELVEVNRRQDLHQQIEKTKIEINALIKQIYEQDDDLSETLTQQEIDEINKSVEQDSSLSEDLTKLQEKLSHPIVLEPNDALIDAFSGPLKKVMEKLDKNEDLEKEDKSQSDAKLTLINLLF